MTDDDVVAYLAGESDTPPRTPDAARLERSRALLADPALWVEPRPDLEQRIIAAVAPRRPRHWVRNAVLGAAAAVIIAVGIGVVITTQRERPVEFAATLQGTELVPAAKGTATMTQTPSGWRIHLHASGLPRLDNGSYYQGWLKDAAGTLVPIGTFNQADDVTLWAGVPPSAYRTITVTRQQASAGPASSGQKVLVGTSRRTQ
jgi:Anti-sigma-K factor rskA